MIGGVVFFAYNWALVDDERGGKNEKAIKIEEIVYIFHNKALFPPYSSHLTS